MMVLALRLIDFPLCISAWARFCWYIGSQSPSPCCGDNDCIRSYWLQLELTCLFGLSEKVDQDDEAFRIRY